jgi:RNA recognition motif-containing protein
MRKKIFIGNLPLGVPEKAIEDLFGQFGAVYSFQLKADPGAGMPCGFAFIEMDQKQADTAIEVLDGYVYFGYKLHIRTARERITRQKENAC